MRNPCLLICSIVCLASTSALCEDLLVFGAAPVSETVEFSLESSPVCEIPCIARFHAVALSSDGSQAPFEINYGDGVIGKDMMHTYTEPGRYAASAQTIAGAVRSLDVEVEVIAQRPRGLGYARGAALSIDDPAFHDGDLEQAVTTGTKTEFHSITSLNVNSIRISGYWPSGFEGSQYPNIVLINGDSGPIKVQRECANKYFGMKDVVVCEVTPSSVISDIVVDTSMPFSITEIEVR